METQIPYTTRSYRMSQYILLLLTLATGIVMINLNPGLSRILFGLQIGRAHV